MKVEVTVVATLNGKFYACGPHDYSTRYFSSPAEAVMCWALEAGERPLLPYVIRAEIPDPEPGVVEALSVEPTE